MLTNNRIIDMLSITDSISNTMTWTTTVTQKGQITIPQAFRKAMGIQPYDSVVIELKKGKVIVKPQKDLLDLAGTLVPPKNKDKSIKQAREAFENKYKRF